jgi:hypothetical protein
MDNPVFGSVKRDPFSRRDAWAWLVENASFKTTVVRMGTREIELQRGQLVVTLQHLGSQWGWDTMKVSRFISAIQRARMTETTTEIGRTLITICNYEEYCIGTTLGEIVEVVSLRHVASVTETGTKEGNNSLLSERDTTSRARRLPRDFVMPLDWIEDGAMAREKAHLPPLDLATEAVKFVNHFVSKAGADGAKRDWHRTWINWCLNARGNANGRSASARGNAADNLIEGFGRAAGLGSADSGVDCSSAGSLLDGEHARFHA